MSDLHEYREYDKHDPRKLPRSFDHLPELRMTVPDFQKDKLVVRLSNPHPRHVRSKFTEPKQEGYDIPTGELPKNVQDWLALNAKPHPRRQTTKFKEPPPPEFPGRDLGPIQSSAIAMLAKPKTVYPRFQEPPPPQFKRYTRELPNSHFYSTLARPNKHKMSDLAMKKFKTMDMATTMPSKPAPVQQSASQATLIEAPPAAEPQEGEKQPQPVAQ